MKNFVEVLRGGKLESRHTIHAAVVDSSDNLRASLGNPDLPTYFRSSAKPFQTLALFRTGVADHFDLSDRELAIITASHNGEDFHIGLVRQILRKIGANEADLRCGFHPPMYGPAAQKFFAENRMPSPIYNNCSGKHAGMLAACKAHNYDLKTYLEPDHPHQRAIRKVIAEFSGVPEGDIHTGVDGCGVPVFYLTLRQMARMYARFAASTEPAVRRVREAMMRYPEWVAGTGRFDTAFMRLLQGRAFSKTGAEGVQSVAFLDPGPIALVAKAEDGQRRGVEPAVVEIMLQLKWISAEEAEALRRFWKPDILNHAGRKVGGVRPKIELNFPGSSS